MKIALINVLSTNVVALYFVIESDCLLFDENISVCVTMLLNVVSNVNIVIECSFRATVAHFRLNENKFPLN